MIAYLIAVALAFSFPGEAVSHFWTPFVLSGAPAGSITLTARPADLDPYRNPWRLYGSYACGESVSGRYLPRTSEAVREFVQEVETICSVRF